MNSNITPKEALGFLIENFKTLTVEDASKVIAEHCVVHEAAGLPLPIAGEWKGPEGFVALMQAIQETIPNFNNTVEKMITNDEDTLVIKGRNSGDLPGGSFDIPLVEYWTFENGMAVDILPVWHDTKLISDLYNV